MKNWFLIRTIQFIHWLHYLSIPFLIASIYFLTIDIAAGNQKMLGTGLILLGFGISLYTLRNQDKDSRLKDRHLRLLLMIYLLFGFALLLTGIMIFATKEGGISNPIGLGLCSCAVGFFAAAKEFSISIKSNPDSSHISQIGP